MDKKCNKCFIAKPLTSFHKDISKPDGYHTFCKLCRGCKALSGLIGSGLKICTKCAEVKIEDEDFSLKNKKTGNRSSICKKCVNKNSAKWYQHNKERHYRNVKPATRKYNIKRREANKELLIRTKNVPCYDCKTAYPHWIMQFDHRDGETKHGNISTMAHNCMIEELLLLEIAKCDVVCGNCHLNRTHLRRNNLSIK